jgi:hypothetical protein
MNAPPKIATARLPAPIGRLSDAAGSAVDNAIRTATGNASPFPGRVQQQISQQRHRLATLLLAHPHKTRRQELEIGLLGQSLRDRQRSQNNINAGEPESVSPIERGPFEGRKVTLRRRETGRIMAHDTDMDPTNHRHDADSRRNDATLGEALSWRAACPRRL